MQMQLAIINQAQPQAIQLSPNRLHASSNYYYHPKLLQPYGISEEDWYTFTYQFVAANSLSRNRLLALKLANAALRMPFFTAELALFMWHPVMPLAVVPASLAVTVTFWTAYFALKHQELKRHIRNGNIPRWLEAWNRQYFNPKGLMIGFNLPGHEVQYAPVVPRPRRFSAFRGTYKQPQSQRSANKRARLVIVRLDNQPVPGAGQAPQITPIKVSRLTKVFVFPKKIGSKIGSRKMRTHERAERDHQKRFDLAIEQASRGQLVEAVSPLEVPTWGNIRATSVYARSTLVRLSRRVFHRRERTNLPTILPVVQPIVQPTVSPKVSPTISPVVFPNRRPTVLPLILPATQPIAQPTTAPTVQPTVTISPTVLLAASSPVQSEVLPAVSSPASSPVQPEVLPAVFPPTPSSIQPEVLPAVSPPASSPVSPMVLPTAPITVSPTVESTASSTLEPTVQPAASTTAPSAVSPEMSPEASPSTTPEVLPKISPVGLDGTTTNAAEGRTESSGFIRAIQSQTKDKASAMSYMCSKCTARAAKKQAKERALRAADGCPRCTWRAAKKQAKEGKQMLGGSRMHDAARIVL